MGYVFDYQDALAYDEWLEKPARRLAFELQSELMRSMIQPIRGKRLIDIGCGTGNSLMPFQAKGAYLTGVDASPYMLDIARAKVGSRVDLHRAYAEDLPFEDNTFHYASLCLALEFVDDPVKALEEACRVAKDGVFVGVMNKFAAKAVERRIVGMFQSDIFNHARFFSIGEIKYLFRGILGDVPVYWRCACHLPGRRNRVVYRIEESGLIQKVPFGSFAGIMAHPVPRMRTIPLALKSSSNASQMPGGVVSCPGHSSGARVAAERCEGLPPKPGAAREKELSKVWGRAVKG
jgi:SAM-dependent methyltransferase